MKEITSVKTKAVQIVSNETWDSILRRGWGRRYKVRDIPSRSLKDVPAVISAPTKTKTKPKSEKKDGKKN